MRVESLANQVMQQINELTALRENIRTELSQTQQGEVSPALRTNQDIRKLKEKERAYDRRFIEEEYSSGKTRHQTLQEFVLLFFFLGVGLLAISAFLYLNITTQSKMKSFLGFLLVLFMGFLASGFILKFA